MLREDKKIQIGEKYKKNKKVNTEIDSSKNFHISRTA